jgi:hypothetical protein
MCGNRMGTDYSEKHRRFIALNFSTLSGDSPAKLRTPTRRPPKTARGLTKYRKPDEW